VKQVQAQVELMSKDIHELSMALTDSQGCQGKVLGTLVLLQLWWIHWLWHQHQLQYELVQM
jgi:hypothetical protein